MTWIRLLPIKYKKSFTHVFTARGKNLNKTWPVSCLIIKWTGRYLIFHHQLCPVTNLFLLLHRFLTSWTPDPFTSWDEPRSRHDDPDTSVTPTPDVIMTKMINLDPIIIRRFVIFCDARGLRLMKTSLLWLSSDLRIRDGDYGWGGVVDDVVINWSKNKCVEILINVHDESLRFNKYLLLDECVQFC